MKIERTDIFALSMQAKPWIADGIVEHQHFIFEAEIDTERRLELFMAEIAHESAHFTTTCEFASGKAYEGRRDLGNRYPGDGPRFRGHGLMQVTGRANHRAATDGIRRIFTGMPATLDFEADPWELTKFPWCLLSAVWYWRSRRINRFADKDDIRAVTKAINGGYNGLAERVRYRERARGLFK